MIKRTILSVAIAFSPMSATKVDWLDDVAVKFGCAPRPPGDNGTVWHCDGKPQARPETPGAEPKKVKYLDKHSLDAVMDRLREEIKGKVKVKP